MPIEHPPSELEREESVTEEIPAPEEVLTKEKEISPAEVVELRKQIRRDELVKVIQRAIITILRNKLTKERAENSTVRSENEAFRNDNKTLRKVAYEDSVSGLLNYAGFYEGVERRKVESNQGDVMAMFDMDGLKKINDSMGHLAGNAFLEAVGDRIKQLIRPNDIASRFGGDEFAVLFADTSKADLEKKFKNNKFEFVFPYEGQERKIVLSVGLHEREEGESLDDLVAKADKEMYDSRERSGHVSREV